MLGSAEDEVESDYAREGLEGGGLDMSRPSCGGSFGEWLMLHGRASNGRRG